MNALSQAQYAANILQCTRQLHYSPANENSVDIVLFLNGIPVVSMELKCQFTGQSVANAMEQYKFDRSGKDPIFTFKKPRAGALCRGPHPGVHDTRLEGRAHVLFALQPGQQRRGQRRRQGQPRQTPMATTPPTCGSRCFARTACWRFCTSTSTCKWRRTKKTGRGKVRADDLPPVSPAGRGDQAAGGRAGPRAPGRNYLIPAQRGLGQVQLHCLAGASPGGGCMTPGTRRSSSPLSSSPTAGCWTASCKTRSTSLTMWKAWCRRSTKTPPSSRDAIEAGAGIIITTLQKFPVIYKEVKAGNKRFAVIVDEAHSSQTGRRRPQAQARPWRIPRRYWRNTPGRNTRRKPSARTTRTSCSTSWPPRASRRTCPSSPLPPHPRKRRCRCSAAGMKTGSTAPFHIYSMRQAIEEGFILDVLQNYMTLQHVLQNCQGHPG